MQIHYPNAKEEADIYSERYHLTVERIQCIQRETEDGSTQVPELFRNYFSTVSRFLLLTSQVFHMSADGIIYQLSLEELQKQNKALYQDILPEQYENSYANPSYAVQMLGVEIGPLLCLLYTELRGNIAYSFEQRLFYLTISHELFIQIYNLMEDPFTTPDQLKSALYFYISDYTDITVPDRTRALLDSEQDFFTSIINTADLTDLRYLYYFGEWISDNELSTTRYLNSLKPEQIEAMAATFTNGYCEGFRIYQINLSKKSTVTIRYRLGFERIIRSAVSQFKEKGLNTTIYRAAVSLIHKNRGLRIGLTSTSPNRQFDYDHRMDDALLLDKALNDRKLAQQRHAYETWKEAASSYAGPAVMEVFGEAPFTPAAKSEASQYSSLQQEIKQDYQSAVSLLTNEFIPGNETSFTIISYPIPEIGEDFSSIFNETILVNTLDSSLYQEIQTCMIHALDQGESVTITGRNGNQTNLTVALAPLSDPSRQTNFENCLSDVNIPLGEVFTSPQLNGTNGLLHVSQVYLNGLKYIDLSLEFENGVIARYDCRNFEKKEENQKYIQENLLYNHKTLPMGEFAIGTNTTAYSMGIRYHISDLLPILIAEKTGPHFAIGDTCFSHEEELATYNPDGKQMTAKENAYSLLRHSQPKKAYFNCHTDITIPYHELGSITVNKPCGSSIPLIEEGQFILPGTKELNLPLSELLSL